MTPTSRSKIILGLFLAILFSCSNYTIIRKTEYLYFGENAVRYNSVFTSPYSGKQKTLSVIAHKGTSHVFYRAHQPISDSLDSIISSSKYPDRIALLKKANIYEQNGFSEDGYIDISTLHLASLDTSIFVVDSTRSLTKQNIEGLVYLRINNMGQSFLQATTPDMTFNIPFKVDTTNLIINPTYVYQNTNRHVFLWFTWPIKQ